MNKEKELKKEIEEVTIEGIDIKKLSPRAIDLYFRYTKETIKRYIQEQEGGHFSSTQ